MCQHESWSSLKLKALRAESHCVMILFFITGIFALDCERAFIDWSTVGTETKRTDVFTLNQENDSCSSLFNRKFDWNSFHHSTKSYRFGLVSTFGWNFVQTELYKRCYFWEEYQLVRWWQKRAWNQSLQELSRQNLCSSTLVSDSGQRWLKPQASVL